MKRKKRDNKQNVSKYQHKEYDSSWQWQVLAMRVHPYLEDGLTAECEICSLCLVANLKSKP